MPLYGPRLISICNRLLNGELVNSFDENAYIRPTLEGAWFVSTPEFSQVCDGVFDAAFTLVFFEARTCF